jgi:hypothetical protein
MPMAASRCKISKIFKPTATKTIHRLMPKTQNPKDVVGKEYWPCQSLLKAFFIIDP